MFDSYSRLRNKRSRPYVYQLWIFSRPTALLKQKALHLLHLLHLVSKIERIYRTCVYFSHILAIFFTPFFAAVYIVEWLILSTDSLCTENGNS